MASNLGDTFSMEREERTNVVVHTPLQVPHGGPALLLLHLRVVVEDLVPQPGQVVHAQLVLLAWRKVSRVNMLWRCPSAALKHVSLTIVFCNRRKFGLSIMEGSYPRNHACVNTVITLCITNKQFWGFLTYGTVTSTP